jgi:hypothetical protein
VIVGEIPPPAHSLTLTNAAQGNLGRIFFSSIVASRNFVAQGVALRQAVRDAIGMNDVEV